MKILFLNQVFYPDGAATAQHTVDLSLYLKDLGCEVTVLTGRRGYNNRQTLYAKEENFRGVQIRRVRSTGFGKGKFWHRLVDAITFDLWLILELLRLPRYDVVLAFTSPPLIGFLGALFCQLKGGKLVSWMMDINPETAIVVGYLKKRSLSAWLLNKIFEFSLKKSAHIVVLDRWMKKKIERHGVPPERIAVIPPWPVHEITPPPALKKENPFRTRYGLNGKFIILYSGNHSIVHPLDTLLEAARQLRDRSDIHFVFIGSGLRVTDVTKAIKKHQLKNVLQLPHQPRNLLEAALSMANLHVVVMGNDVSGLVHTSKVYGILATGTPYVAISPRESHLVDLLARCPYGFHVEHGNAKELVGVIEQVKNFTPEAVQQFQRRNIEFLHNHYTAALSLRAFAEKVLALAEPSAIPTEPLRPTLPIS